ncbi:hypothetical protein SAMN06265222_106296 [Neorhodopirellula lusitana]|uniref:Uncharacterized protein n=1 Tax=Neorhodopirellula lusitana TaxID=445327 RepID=A0ABY1Q9B4_9BACT|nr:hypothetical protein [Neorhodopirellula lusitana]SMP59961.1 hypothetical protein SAMN06265222_106296 [Neorhodopirellula lusitana]
MKSTEQNPNYSGRDLFYSSTRPIPLIPYRNPAPIEPGPIKPVVLNPAHQHEHRKQDSQATDIDAIRGDGFTNVQAVHPHFT